jgi:hypothetical protein
VRECFGRGEVVTGEDVWVEGVDPCCEEGCVQDVRLHRLGVHRHVLLNNVVPIHLDVLIELEATMFGPVMLCLHKDNDIEGLEFVGTFGGEGNHNDIVLDGCFMKCI